MDAAGARRPKSRLAHHTVLTAIAFRSANGSDQTINRDRRCRRIRWCVRPSIAVLYVAGNRKSVTPRRQLRRNPPLAK